MPTTVFRVISSADDMQENGPRTPFEPDVTDLVGRVGARTDPMDDMYYCCGFRFQNITIPHGAIITSAKFSGYVYTELADDINCKIYGHKVGNAENFVDNLHVISETYRPRTVASVPWVQNTLGLGWKESPELKAIIQEIVNMPEWRSGNAIVLLLIANTDIAKDCNFISWDCGLGGSEQPFKCGPGEKGNWAAKLEITWITAVKLEINSSPITGVPFTIDGLSGTTPFTSSIETGTYTITMPETVAVNGARYAFAGWADGSTERIRTINITSDTSLTALYEVVSVTHTLSVQSSPITGIPVTVDESPVGATPISVEVVEGGHAISVPPEVEV